MRVINNSGLLSFVLVRTIRSSCIASSHLIKKLNNKLKVIISLLSGTESEYESFTILFYGNPLNSACDCTQMAVTTVVVTKNVHRSRHWKAKLVAYGIHEQSL
jgi:hypothetical protein